jgi:glycopeptide antibiotics resistance protein
MLPLRYVKHWCIAGIGILFFVLILAVLPTFWFWSAIAYSKFPLLDKWLHILTFLFLFLWFSGQYHRSSYWRLIVGLTTFGIFIELCQGMVSYRTTEWMDLVANIFGIGIALIIAIVGAGGWSLRFEQWLEKKKGWDWR